MVSDKSEQRINPYEYVGGPELVQATKFRKYSTSILVLAVLFMFCQFLPACESPKLLKNPPGTNIPLGIFNAFSFILFVAGLDTYFNAGSKDAFAGMVDFGAMSISLTSLIVVLMLCKSKKVISLYVSVALVLMMNLCWIYVMRNFSIVRYGLFIQSSNMSIISVLGFSNIMARYGSNGREKGDRPLFLGIFPPSR